MTASRYRHMPFNTLQIVLNVQGADDVTHRETLSAATATDGMPLETAINEERSILWATDYGSITIDELHADSTSVGNWAKMSYETGLDSYNVEIVMEWGMNALLYAYGNLNGNYYGASTNWGITVVFDAQSTWLVEHNSYLGQLTIEEGATIQAPAGYSIRMTVNGEEALVAPGTYTGEIIIILTEK